MVVALRRIGAEIGRIEFRQLAPGVDAEHLLQDGARRAVFIGGVDHLCHHGDRGQGTDQFGRSQQLVAELHLPRFVLDGLGTQHGVREIQVPLVRWHVGALGHVADVAQVALVDDFPEFFLGHAGGFLIAGFVDQVEQEWEGIAQRDAAAAAVADVEDALHLLFAGGLVVEPRVLPVYGVSGGCFEIAFAHGVLPGMEYGSGVGVGSRRWRYGAG
jgi:hypothetical protein